MKTLTYLSFGAGVQSTALLVMSALGLKGCPRAEVAIFADTQDEPDYVYEHLDAMEKWVKPHGIKILRVTKGRLSDGLTGRSFLPAFTMAPDGSPGMLLRKCTDVYKIRPIEEKVKRLCGLKKGQRVSGPIATTMIGISTDEVSRAKPSQDKRFVRIFPLIDAGMNRDDCLFLIRDMGLPIPKKSACVFCPYHHNTAWEQMRLEHPKDFARAVEVDCQIRDLTSAGVNNPVFLHRSLKPLNEVNFTGDPGQSRFAFDNECEGMCGV